MKNVLLLATVLLSLQIVAQQPCIPGSSPLNIGGNSGTNSITVGTCSNAAFAIKSRDTVRLNIRPDGRIWFGRKQVVPNHPHSNSLFQFDGKVACQELVVVDPAKWADFVFNSSYQLISLKALEEYYRTFKHLPDVPTANQVMSEGLNLAEMDAILLQKIEELTLYVVELNKKVELLREENSRLRAALK